MPTEEQVNRMKVHWKRSRDHFQSFLTLLAEARQEIGDDDKFASWCIWQLGIGVSVIGDVAGILRKADADVAKADLRSAKEAEKATQKAKRDAEAAERERARLDKEARKAAAVVAAKKETRQKQSRASYQRQKIKQMATYAASAATPEPALVVVKVTNHELAVKIKAAYGRLNQARAEWVEASVELAKLLCDARSRMTSDNAFGDWLMDNSIPIGKNDRAALLNLGVNLTGMRQALENTSRSSYQLIWGDVQRQLAAVS
jgi:hypothetical protein